MQFYTSVYDEAHAYTGTIEIAMAKDVYGKAM